MFSVIVSGSFMHLEFSLSKQHLSPIFEKIVQLLGSEGLLTEVHEFFFSSSSEKEYLNKKNKRLIFLYIFDFNI